MAYFKKSPWVLHYDASSCNGCDIETIACLTPMYDTERLGLINTGNPKHADMLLITGSVNEQNVETVRNLYNQMPDPKVVVAIGICATSGGVFAECYNIKGGVDKIIPVDVYVPGCAAKPELIIDGIIRALQILEEKNAKLQKMARGLEEITIQKASVEDAAEILALQKLAFQSEAEIYSDFSIAPLTQTLDELKGDFKKKTFLKVVMGGKIIGSVRAYVKGNACYIERLIVNPSYWHHGIGKKLMDEVAKHFASVEKYEIHTGKKSKQSIIFYRDLGYKIFRRGELPHGGEGVFMQKLAAGAKR